MQSPPIQMLGTEVRLVLAPRRARIAGPCASSSSSTTLYVMPLESSASFAFLQKGQEVKENMTTGALCTSESMRASTFTSSKSPATSSAVHCLKPPRRRCVSSLSFCGSEPASAHAEGSPVQPSASSCGSAPSRRASLTAGPASGSIVPSELRAPLCADASSSSEALRCSDPCVFPWPSPFGGPGRRSCRTPSPALTSQLSMCRQMRALSGSNTCSTPHGHASTGFHGRPSCSFTSSRVLYEVGTPLAAPPVTTFESRSRTLESMMNPPARFCRLS
mmetsp:Transcript_23871/g.52179  ORF Transcript_23871/g.52179 Transcript_23871/m.52179 type:complete len:276 (-) Transcript_23871:500-1327(-)